MSKDPDWIADLARYPRRPFLREQSIWAIWVYRFGRRTDRRADGFVKWMHTKIYWLLFKVVETSTGISLPKEASHLAFRQYFYTPRRHGRRQLHVAPRRDHRQPACGRARAGLGQ
jgi:hypothetical protein